MAGIVVNLVLLSGCLLLSRISGNRHESDKKRCTDRDEKFSCERCKKKGKKFDCQNCEKNNECPTSPTCPTVCPGTSTEETRIVTTRRDCSPCPTIISFTDCRSTNTEGVASSPGPSSSSIIPGCSSGSVIGAVLGGALLGSAVTAVVFLCIRRRLRTSHEKKSPSKAMRNPVYQLEGRVSQQIPDTAQPSSADYAEVNDETRKSANVSTIRRPDLEAESTPNTGDIYNLLNETDRVDVSDYYDHAKPVPSSVTLPDSGYGVVSYESGDVLAQNKEKNKIIPVGDKMSTEEVLNDDYFLLEKQTV
ncbi:uncharacterized protein LOC125655036 isoform X2 [Ostrea edulis]|uniref:uncharacterized protein LOC125655036 isoform X2 n=1 Tax=Ostrea edulis TaxID=37623 RepID=UPI0024AF97E8|nr:uncharacterized protein LOC125655036 isoform X2 [Ostrea edulis]